MERDESLERLFRLRGAVKRVAQGLGISTAAVSQWKRVPQKHVSRVAEILEVPQSEVRQDPRDEQTAARTNPEPARGCAA